MSKIKSILTWPLRHKKLSILLVILLAVVLFASRSGSNGESLDSAQVEKGEVVEELVLSGTVTADEYAQLSFPVSGKISWVDITEGEPVKKGQALAKLDTTTLNSAYQSALSAWRATSANADQVRDDLKGNDSDETFAQRNTRTAAEAANDQAYEAVVVARRNLVEGTLVSPFAGIATFVENPFSGVNVIGGQTQIEVINPETIYFQVAADQTEITDIAPGDKVTINLDADQDNSLQGTVQFVSFSTIPGEVGAVYKVRVNFANVTSEVLYRIGMTGDAHFVLNKKENVLWVPSNFIKSDDNGDYVLTNEGRDKTYVDTGLEGEDRTEIISGIDQGVTIYD